MADEDVNEDQWLYGDSNPDKSNDVPAEDNLYGDKFENSLDSNAATQLPPVLEPPIIEPPKILNSSENANQDSINEKLPGETEKDKNAEQNGEEEEGEDGEVNDESKEDEVPEGGEGRNEDDEDDDDDSEDDVNVVIGEIKTSSQYTIKRGGLLSSGPQMKQPGKFSIEEFETIGTINGIPAHDFSLDSLEDKPWRKPGADITDYFNYGFNEETWRSYCERQKRMRVQESGAGLSQLSGNIAPQIVNQAAIARGNIPVTIVNDNSKYAAPPGSIAPTVVGPRKAGPPPGRRVGGSIDVLGNANLNPPRGESPPKGNVIQVMTADRREYSRKAGFPDMSVPPPIIPPGIPPPGFDTGPFGADYSGEYYNSEMDPYYQAYEPTQDSQWANSGWDQDDIKVLPPAFVPPTPGAAQVLTSETSNQDSQDATDKSNSALPGGVVIKQERETSKERERDREKERERSERERDRVERHRERSHRHRSRSRSTERRSRKHKSRSRSPGHRSHKKKKSKKSDRAKEESD